MPNPNITKRNKMRENGSFNHRSDNVTAKIFNESPFFDVHDIIQVKYEMLRVVEKEHIDVSSAAEEFGFSRVSFYQIKKEFDKNGIAGLMPKKRGPKGSRKLSSDDVEFAKSLVDTHTRAQIVTRLREERGVKISKRTLERQLAVKQISDSSKIF